MLSAPVYVAASPEPLALGGPELCAELARRVRLQRGAWVPRHAALPAFSFGPACELDLEGPEDLEAYLAGVASYASPMRQLFDDFWPGLTGRLAAHLKAPVRLSERLALPSFRIIEAHPHWGSGLALAPQQHQAMLWPWGQGAEQAPSFSFVMAVELPAAGAGLDVWAVDVAAWRAWPEAEREAKLAAVPRQDRPLALGELLLHSGRWVHRVALPSSWAAGDERLIVLEGHALFVEGAWELFG